MYESFARKAACWGLAVVQYEVPGGLFGWMHSDLMVNEMSMIKQLAEVWHSQAEQTLLLNLHVAGPCSTAHLKWQAKA